MWCWILLFKCCKHLHIMLFRFIELTLLVFNFILGYYQDQINSTSCLSCPGGYFCPLVTSLPVKCLQGYYSLPASNNCSICGGGKNCSITDMYPSDCVHGFFSQIGFSSCSECPLGTYTLNSGSTICLHCAAGNYCNSTSSLNCPLGYYSEADSTSCSVCPVGTYTLTGSTLNSCLICPAGFYCQNGIVINSCDLGYWSTNGSSSCVLCNNTLGQYSPTPAATSCVNCPIYQECLNPSTSSYCMAGFYSVGSQHTCKECPAGKYAMSTGLSSCLLCASGYFCSRNSSTICLAGFIMKCYFYNF